jgi:nudix-type nucleoside diphosphatase (YffH/AdpP family)
MTYQIVRTHTVHEGWCKIVVATIRTPDGETIRREIEDHGTVIALLPYDPERRVAMLVRQFRPPPFFAAGQAEMVEAVAGFVEEDEPAADSARREAEEEVGLAIGAMEAAGAVWTSPGLSTERTHLFLAAYGAGDRVGKGGGVATEHEAITLEETPLADLAARADAGSIDDLKLLALVQTLRLRRPELF